MEAGKFYRRWERLADQSTWPTLDRSRHFALPQGTPIMPADSMALASFNPSIPVCRERVVSVQRQEDPAACVFANQTKLLLSRFLAKSVAVGDEITFPIPAPDAVGPEILDHQECRLRIEPLYLPGANRIRQPAQAGQTKSVLRLGRSSPGKPWHRHDFPALRGPARVLLSPAACGRQRRSSHSVRGLAYPGQRFALRASRGFQAARSGAKDGGRSAQ